MKKKTKPQEPHPRNLLLRGKTWYTRAIVNGKQIFHSLHTSTLEEAIERRDEMLAVIQKRATEKTMLQNVKRQLAGIEQEEEQEREASNQGILLKDAFGKFEKDPERRPCKPRQLENHRSNWNAFLLWMQKNHKEISFCRQVTRAVIKEWSTDIYSNSKTINTYNKHLSTVHYVFNTICEYDEFFANPTAYTHKKKETDSRNKEPFEDEELERIFSFPDEEFKRLCAIGLYTTLRLTSARKLTWKQYDGAILHAVHEKTGADATQIVADDLKYWLERVPEDERNGFITPTWANKPTPSSASQLFQSYLHKIGIKTQEVITGINGKNRTVCTKGFHSFRHTAITKALENGASVSDVKRLAGHATERMQEHYSHLGADVAGRAASKIGRYWKNQDKGEN